MNVYCNRNLKNFEIGTFLSDDRLAARPRYSTAGCWRICRKTPGCRPPSWPGGWTVSGPGLQKRLRKLEEQGVIRGYSTVVNREAVGLDLLCFIHVTLAHHRPNSVKQFPEKIKKMPEVLECHFLTGEFDYLLKVVVANHDHLEKFLFGKLMKAGGIDRTRTSIVVKEVKTSTSLPL